MRTGRHGILRGMPATQLPQIFVTSKKFHRCFEILMRRDAGPGRSGVRSALQRFINMMKALTLRPVSGDVEPKKGFMIVFLSAASSMQAGFPRRLSAAGRPGKAPPNRHEPTHEGRTQCAHDDMTPVPLALPPNLLPPLWPFCPHSSRIGRPQPSREHPPRCPPAQWRPPPASVRGRADGREGHPRRRRGRRLTCRINAGIYGPCRNRSP